MNISELFIGLAGVTAALAGGAAGKEVGNRVGSRPWQKILAPAGATAVATIYHAFTGDTETAKDLAVGGVTLGVTATGIFSVVKNLRELIKLF